ncbi:unnamed protein product [Triticum turgidum subsp. durum]|nr:unnamed protein product [Triticum turgidum subsp. durum]
MSLYQAYGIDHLVIATRDYLFAPSLEDICRAIDFIHQLVLSFSSLVLSAMPKFELNDQLSAERFQTAMSILLHAMRHKVELLMFTVKLIKYRNMTPEAALDHVRSIRPRVLLAPSQWQAVIVFSTLTTGRLPVRSTNLNCYLEGTKASIPDSDIEDCTVEFDYDDSGLPLCQVMVPRPSSPTGCVDAVFITEADLEGYDAYVDTGKDVVTFEVVASRKPIMRRLSCLFGSLKVTSNCEPAPSRFTEVRAC